MSQFTVEIRILDRNGFDFGLKKYPIWDESKRPWLNERIINHYYNCEIGFETPGIFKFELNNRMEEVMPYLNPIFKKLFDDNSFDLYDIGELVQEVDSEANSNGSSATDGEESRTYTESHNEQGAHSTLPNQILSWTDIGENVYATEGNVAKGNKNDTTSTKTNASATDKENTKSNSISVTKGNRKGEYNFEIISKYTTLMFPTLQLLWSELDSLFMTYYGGVSTW